MSNINKLKKYSQKSKKVKLYQPKPKKLNLAKRIALASSFAATILCGVALYSNRSKPQDQNTHSTTMRIDENDLNKLDIEQINGTELYKFNSLNVEELNKLGFNLGDTWNDYDIRCNLLEFASIMGNEEITWDDIKTVVSNNPNIPDRYKTLLYSACDNLKSSNINLSLAALKYNLERIEFKSFTDSNLAGIESVTGYFVVSEHTIYLREGLESEKYDKTVLHEIFHGFTTAHAEVNGKKIICDTSVDVLNKPLNSIETLGYIYIEGLTDYITACALGEQIDCADPKWSYGFNLYQLLMMSHIAGIDIDEYGNRGVEYLFDKLSKKGMQELITMIADSDRMYSWILQSWTNPDLLKYYNQETFNVISEVTHQYYNSVLNETGDKSIAYDKAHELLNSYEGYIIPKKVTSDGKEYTLITDAIGYAVLLEEFSKVIDYFNGITY